MAFTIRNFETILNDMIDHVRATTTLTDFNIGSVVRTLLEAAAHEDDEQYFQMVQLLDAFSMQTAVGVDLERKVGDYGIVRLQPTTSSVEVFISDSNLTRTTTAVAHSSGATTLQVTSGSSFPSSGYPITLRVGEGSPQIEDATATAINTSTTPHRFTLSPGLVNSHSAGVRVAIVTGDANRTIAAGQVGIAPATSDDPQITFTTTEPATIVNGNYDSNGVQATSTQTGKVSNVGPTRISQFAGSGPFSGALIRNPLKAAGGRNLETDAELRDRARASLQSLSRGTRLTLKSQVIGVVDDVTGQRVVSSGITEDFLNDEVLIIIDDGTGFTPDTVSLPRDSLVGDEASGGTTIRLSSATSFPSTGRVIISPENSSQIEDVAYISKNGNALTLESSLLRSHDAGDQVILVDEIHLDAEEGQNFFQLSQFPIVRSSDQIWTVNPSGFPVLATAGTDYFLNRGNGNVEMAGLGLSGGSKVLGNYTYYTGLVKTAQKVIEGDLTDSVNFPGLKAAGVIALVEAPVIRRIRVAVAISAVPGVEEDSLTEPVKSAIEGYVRGVGVGEDIIVAEIIERAMGIPGVMDVSVSDPATNITIAENELAIPTDAIGNLQIFVN